MITKKEQHIKGKKTLATHFGKLKRGLDGLEYQKMVRNEWN